MLVVAGVTAFAAAYLAHTAFGMPPSAIRHDALGMAARITAFMGAGMLARRRDK
jgi:hypothetical protein